jgi:hypothetical protein
MDIKQLLEKMEEFAGEKVGQKPGDQWRGTDAAPPGKKLVGSSESVLKDLSKGKTPKSKEQELSEEFQAFLEAEFKDTVDKRPGRKSDRHARGHEPQARYKTVKADESVMSEKDIELQDYRSMSHKEFQTAYGMTKTEWINKNKALVIQNPSIKKALGLDEGSKEDGPVEARWMVKVSDDEGDHLKTYSGKYPNLSAAKKAYKKYEPYASNFKYKPVKKDKVEEAVGQNTFNRAGYNPIRDERDYLKKLSDLSNLSRKPGLDQQMKDQIKQRILDLNAEARTKGYIQAESRAHKVISTKLKNLERERKFASGELKIPTPQERQAQLAKQQPKKEKVDEYGADNPAQATTQKASPAQAQQVAANLNTQKTALSQLKQINPEIDPQKAAMAVTKDVATMSPQEKEELAQVAKTLSPALGTPALGSIKTAIQKSQLQAKK